VTTGATTIGMVATVAKLYGEVFSTSSMVASVHSFNTVKMAFSTLQLQKCAFSLPRPPLFLQCGHLLFVSRLHKLTTKRTEMSGEDDI
jgi:hypothetical protein